MTAPRRQFCKNGHDRTAPGALSGNSCRQCKIDIYHAQKDGSYVEKHREKEPPTDTLLALWKQLETAMPFDRPSIRERIRELAQ